MNDDWQALKMMEDFVLSSIQPGEFE